MAAHSKIGASSSYRWLECPGSVILCESAPEQKSSVYAEEGTAAHELAEKCLNSGQDADAYIGLEINGFEVDESMAEHVQVYVDEVRRDRETYDDYSGCETRIHLGWIDEDMFGTSDSHCGKRKSRLVVHDLKYGAGIPVDAIENTQGLFYVIGVAAKYKFEFEEYEFVIVQPRAFHPDGPIRRWVFSKDRLKQFEKELKSGIKRIEKARAAHDIMQYLKAGDHCRFCAAAITCPEIARKTEMAVFEDFDPVTDDVLSVAPTPPHELTPERLLMALEFSHVLEDWIHKVRSYAYQQAEEGNPPPGYKLVQKQGRRKWKNKDKAMAALELFGYESADLVTPGKLKTPAQIEKLFKKGDQRFVNRFTMVPDTGSVLVSDKDKREALTNDVTDDFAAIE